MLAVGAVAERIYQKVSAPLQLPPTLATSDLERRVTGLEVAVAHERERAQAHREEVLVTLARIEGKIEHRRTP